jgi:hypothetical protein
MTEPTIESTVCAIDQALARTAINIAGSTDRAQALMLAVSRGEQSDAVASFVEQTAALLRARILLAHALPRRQAA